MKNPIILTALSAVAITASAFAGETVHHHKDYKPVVAPVPCFPEREWQIDIFGTYAFSSSGQEDLFGDHAWGGGLGVNYFFTHNIGVGVEGMLLDPRHGRDVLGQAGLNLFYRFPLPDSCLAPYVYLGGGAVFNPEDLDKDDFDVDIDDDDDDDDDSDDALWEGHAGAGLEYRINQHFGVFSDVRFNLVEKNDNNFWSIRAGFKIAF